MKNLFLPFILLIFQCSYGQSKKMLSDQEKLNDCIASNTSHFIFNGNRPIGKAWEIIENMFEQNQFVAWGEYHNSPKLSELTAFAMSSAAKYGYHTLCVETSPFAATELMRISHSDKPTELLEQLYKQGYPGIGIIPFFNTKEDAQILIAAKNLGYHIWGIDQEFQTGFPYALNKIYNSQSKKIKMKYKGLIDSLQSKWWYPETKLLDSFRYIVPQKNFKVLLEEIKISKEIYRYSDNEARATLMKKNFYNYHDKSKNSKVFFKMGSNHLAKGINLQTNLYDIGNSIFELAQKNRTGFTNIYLMVRYTTTKKGILIDDMYADEHENPKVFSKLYNSEKWILVDVRKMRNRLAYDGSLPRDTYSILEKYDYVLVSPEIMND